jgi:hypothetical protein
MFTVVRVNLGVARGQTLEFSEVDVHGPEQVPQASQSDAERADIAQSKDENGTEARWYPERYEVTESRIAPLSQVHNLIDGARSIYVIRVLTERSSERGLINPYVITCVQQAGRFVGTTKDSPIRRDPTEVCPGVWTPPFGAVDDDAVKLYGLVGATAEERISLAPQRSAGRDPADTPR